MSKITNSEALNRLSEVTYELQSAERKLKSLITVSVDDEEVMDKGAFKDKGVNESIDKIVRHLNEVIKDSNDLLGLNGEFLLTMTQGSYEKPVKLGRAFDL